ncbi:hypothetical protein [Paraburkholderia caffeinilytica]|uniref:hypothetical protein n=1 Tax=Paraburkholderia caffeinilytica TaxID=1761016 RepID=UPI003DA0C3F0
MALAISPSRKETDVNPGLTNARDRQPVHADHGHVFRHANPSASSRDISPIASMSLIATCPS